MPSNSTKLKAPGSSSHPKANSIPKAKPLTASCPAQSYVVIDATLPSHIINDQSLFTTYMPSRWVYRTAFGNNITIEGIGDAHFCVFAAGKFILFCMRNYWHIPSSPHHFLSCPAITSIGCQVMIASRTPRLLFSHKHHLSKPNLPKYVPLTKMDGYFVLKYEIPLPGSVFSQTASTTSQVTAVSLHVSIYQPFSDLPVLSQPHSPSSRSPQSHNFVSPSPPLHFSAFSFIHHDPSVLQVPEKVLISQPFSSLNYTLFDSQPSFDSPDFYDSTFNPPSEASISILSYPIPTFNPQSIQQPQRPSLLEPLPVLHNFTVPSFNPPSETPFPIISYPVPTFNPQSIQQLPHTLPPQLIFQPSSINTPGFVLAPPPLSLSTTPSLPHWQSPRLSSSSRPSYSSSSLTSPLIQPISFPPRLSHLSSPSCSASPTLADFRTAEHAMQKGDAPENAGSARNGGASLMDVNISANGGAMTIPPLFAHTFEAIHPILHPHSQPRCWTHSSPLGLIQPRLLPFPLDSRDTLISRSLPLHPPISHHACGHLLFPLPPCAHFMQLMSLWPIPYIPFRCRLPQLWGCVGLVVLPFDCLHRDLFTRLASTYSVASRCVSSSQGGSGIEKKRPWVDFFDKASSVGLTNLPNQEHF